MDIQKLLDAVSATGRQTRSGYHLTLGALTKELEAVAPGMLVVFDNGFSVGSEHSYRGYYDDLSFESDAVESTAATVLDACRRAAAEIYEGYKGGDFTYDERTPLWHAPYGCCGSAIVGLIEQDGKLVLLTKDVEA